MVGKKEIAKIVTNLFLIGILSFISGKFVYKLTNDNLWFGFNYYFFVGIFILITLLLFNNYLWFTVMSMVLILGSVLFLYYKVNLADTIQQANNIANNNGTIFSAMKNNVTNFSFFFWVMFTISCITVIGIIIARKAYQKMKLKDGDIGDKGEEGPRGDTGNPSPILNSPGEICYQQLLLHCETLLEKIKRNRNIPFEDGDIHLKNLHFKDNLNRIAFSDELQSEVFKLIKCKLGPGCPGYSRYCREKQRFMAVIIEKIKGDLEQWIERICIYEKGLSYLSQEFALPKDWEVLYLNKDKEKGLKQNPYDHLTFLSHNWGNNELSNFTDCCNTLSVSTSSVCVKDNYTWNWGLKK